MPQNQGAVAHQKRSKEGVEERVSDLEIDSFRPIFAPEVKGVTEETEGPENCRESSDGQRGWLSTQHISVQTERCCTKSSNRKGDGNSVRPHQLLIEWTEAGEFFAPFQKRF